ncbi:amidase [Nocardioides marmoriginsengisoli]|uniref:Amidase n=1 Tax=Nocardioides marmoriginsengisoli TaxID=661483 RepID=A0A3N0CCE0_9ACTN|nr:amidase [Nocardioides marmoriginsengisoli]RNL61112.1 amidase [Nocardioides marmoriginsengisoli]
MTLPAPRARVHAFTDDALADHDAVGLAEEIRAGRVSAAEAVDAAIARVEVLQPELNGMSCADFDRARARATRPGSGFFAGVPTFVKDNSDVQGLPTQQGCSAYVGIPAKADGDFAAMFFGTGVIGLGKTQLSEFGFSASAEFANADPVRNPWHTGYSSGASSAGSAAFVAGGAVPIAHANDGGGSIRIPAGCNGLIGLKPTRGRVPQDKLIREMPLRIVADGVVSRSVRDTAAFLRESEKHYRNLKMPPIGDVRGPGGKRLRIALIVDSIGDLRTDPEVVDVVRAAAKQLEGLGHHVEEIAVPVPDYFIDDFLAYWSLLASFMLTTGKRTFGPTFRRELTDNLSKGLAKHGVRQAWRLPLTLGRLGASKQVSRRFFADYDAVLTPVLAKPTPELGWLNPAQPYEVIIDRLVQLVNFTPLQNATGDPAISLPLGTSVDGLPIGVQLATGWGREARLLEVAYELEEAVGFARIQDA